VGGKKIGFAHKRRKEDGLLAALVPIGSSAYAHLQSFIPSFYIIGSKNPEG
jgi:hypothetical protein